MALNLSRAIEELKAVSVVDIQVETAWKWASRAAAAYELSLSDTKPNWIIVGEDYRHEALEHAALCEDADFVQHILDAIERYRDKAFRRIYS